MSCAVVAVVRWILSGHFAVVAVVVDVATVAVVVDVATVAMIAIIPNFCCSYFPLNPPPSLALHHHRKVTSRIMNVLVGVVVELVVVGGVEVVVVVGGGGVVEVVVVGGVVVVEVVVGVVDAVTVVAVVQLILSGHF